MVQIIRNRKCNRCKREDETGSVITAQYKPEGYVCRECYLEYRKFYDHVADEFIEGKYITKTLRDEFAMAALGLVTKVREPTEETLAKFAYRIADAMLEARKAKGE